MTIRVAIVGNGLSSSILADQLLESRDIHIDTYCPDSSLGKGVAYSQDTPDSMILNYAVKDMRFRHDDGHSFLKHIRDHHDHNATVDNFVPRRVFGDYVEQSMRDQLACSSRLCQINSKVKSIDSKDNDIEISTDEGTEAYDYCILAIGNGDAYETAKDGIKSIQSGDFSDNKVHIIGAGLTAIDYINYMFSQPANPPHQVVLSQRRQGFRSVRPTKREPIKLKVLTDDLFMRSASFACDEVKELISREIAAQGVDYDWTTCGGLFDSKEFEQDLAKVLRRLALDPQNDGNHPEYKVYSIFQALATPIQRFFTEARLPVSEVYKFRALLEKPIFNFLAPMPPQTALFLSKILETGKLVITTIPGTDFDITLDARGANGILHENDHQKTPELISHLINKSMLRISPTGGIFHDTRNNMAKTEDGDPSRLYIIGSMQKGQIFDCSDSGAIYQEASKISQDIISRGGV